MCNRILSFIKKLYPFLNKTEQKVLTKVNITFVIFFFFFWFYIDIEPIIKIKTVLYASILLLPMSIQYYLEEDNSLYTKYYLCISTIILLIVTIYFSV